VQQPHQLLLRGPFEGLVVAAHLRGDRHAEQEAQQTHDHLRRGGLGAEGLLQPAPHDPLLVPALRGARALAHDRNRSRRIAAALEKIRMPSTTITAVESWEPTPSWSPRNTRNEAISTLKRNEVM